MKHSPPSNKKANQFIVMLLLLTFLQACKKETNSSPQLTSSFTVKEVIMHPAFYDKEVNDTDSISTTAVTFEANEKESTDISYKWQIGADSRIFTTKKVTLDFFSSPATEIDVTLTVTKNNIPNSASPLTQTTTRKVFLKKETQIPGIYRGVFHFNNGDDSATVTIQKDFNLPKYDPFWKPYYKGTLISSTIPIFDTIFVSNGQPQTFLNRMYYVNEQDWSMTGYPEINKKVIDFKGSIQLLNSTNKIKINITAKETNTSKPTSINFEGFKVK